MQSKSVNNVCTLLELLGNGTSPQTLTGMGGAFIGAGGHDPHFQNQSPERSSKNYSTSHLICLRSTHFENSTGCRFSGASNLSLPLSLSKPCTHNEVPPYLARLLTPYRPSRVLRSSFSSNLLQVPRTNLTFGSRSFRAAAPTVWNFLPDFVRSPNTLNSFRHHLKTHYFQAAFNTP